jgi:hypothetical protein
LKKEPAPVIVSGLRERTKINHEETKSAKEKQKIFVLFVSSWLTFWGEI